MFSRFNAHARRTVILAQEEARLLNHNYVGTEHLLLALARPADTAAGRILESQGASNTAVRDRIVGLIGAGVTGHSGHLPFTLDATSALEAAVREAIMFGHDYVGTEHLLLGLAGMQTGAASLILTNLASSTERILDAATAALRDAGPAAEESAGPGFTLSA